MIKWSSLSEDFSYVFFFKRILIWKLQLMVISLLQFISSVFWNFIWLSDILFEVYTYCILKCSRRGVVIEDHCLQPDNVENMSHEMNFIVTRWLLYLRGAATYAPNQNHCSSFCVKLKMEKKHLIEKSFILPSVTQR